jgi:predicted ATPase
LGTGISQVLPIVVASNYDSLGLICIEQPELHLHPRFQVELADLFLEARDKHSFLIETHSEHIVLRLLRRIRESSKAKTDKNIVSLDDISVVYLSPSPDGTIAERLAITTDGDFEHDWPHGFFDERDEELF